MNDPQSLNNPLKIFFCKHDPENVQVLSCVNNNLASTRNMQICRKCGATSAMVKFNG